MAQEFLSQDEVDALLKGVGGEAEEPSAAEAEASGPVRNYNLATQERIVRGRMPTLELINERFARNLRLGLFNYMHRTTEISIAPVRVQKYSEFVRNLVVPTNLNLIQVKPLRGTGMIVFDPSLVFLVVDNMFGGDGRFHSRVEGRDFTPTELRIVQGMLRVVFEEYEKAWKPVFQVKFEYVRSEMNSQFANIATPSEVVIAATFTLEFGNSTAEMHICLPYSMIEPIREVLNSAMQSDHVTFDKRWVATLTSQLHKAEVELAAQLGTAQIPLRRVLEMRTGDIIGIDIPEKVALEVEDVPVVECRYGVQNGHYALRVERFFAQDAAPAAQAKS